MVVEGGHDSGGATLAGKDASDVAFDFIRKCEDSGVSPAESARVSAPVSAPVSAKVSPPVSAPTTCQDDPSWRGK